MRRIRPLALVSIAAALLGLCCASPPADSAAPPRSWVQWMEEVIGPGFDNVLVPAAAGDVEDMDMAAIARTAREMAKGFALGDGPLEIADVPDFAARARRAAAWAEAIVTGAEAGRGAEVQRLIVRGEAEHCDACHDAAGEIP